MVIPCRIESPSFLLPQGLCSTGDAANRRRDAGFAVRRGDSIALTPSGMFVSNYILSDILDFADLGGEIFKG